MAARLFALPLGRRCPGSEKEGQHNVVTERAAALIRVHARPWDGARCTQLSKLAIMRRIDAHRHVSVQAGPGCV